MDTQCIGFEANCPKNCRMKVPHNHKTLPLSECKKQIKKRKLLEISELVTKYQKLLTQQTEKIIDNIMQSQQPLLKKLQHEIFSVLKKKGAKLTSEEIQNFKDLSSHKFQKLNCCDVYSALNGNQKCQEIPNERQLQVIAKDSFNSQKNSLIKIIEQNFKSFEVSKSQIVKNVDECKNKSVEEEIEKNMTLSSINIIFDDDEIQDQSSFKNDDLLSLLQNIKRLDNSEQSSHQNVPEQFFKKNIPVDNPYTMVTKQMNPLPVKDNLKKISQQSIGYCLDKKTGRYFVRVYDLQKEQFKNGGIFNIKLKIVKKMFFRLLHDKKSGKNFKKIKFVGGDQTGLIVCFTNYIPEMVEGSFITLYECSLINFKGVSNEIVNTKCHSCEDKQMSSLTINKKFTISNIDVNTYSYTAQKQDVYWPSVGCLKSMNPKLKKIQLIVKIDEIIEISKTHTSCWISDGTGSIFAIILMNKTCTQLQKGKVYLLQKIQVADLGSNIKCAKTVDDEVSSSCLKIEQFHYDH